MPQQPLRVLQVLRAPIGGLFRHVVDLTRALAEREHAVGVVADSQLSDQRTEETLAALAPVATLGVHRMPIPRLLGLADLTTSWKIRALARKLGAEVLHGHGAKGGFNARLARAGSRSQVALYTPHGGVLHFAPTSIAGRVFRLLERALLSQTDAMIFESAFARQAFSSQIVAPTCPVRIIHNGLAPSEFTPIIPTVDARDFVFIGEFRELKGIGYLLDAFVDVAAPDGRPATLIMAGDGPDRDKFEAQIARLGLRERVTLAGVQPARNMLELGRCAIVPSLAESLPYVVLEAASAARPVIATDVGGVKEIFGPTAGSLIPAADTYALRRAMQAFMDDPDAAEGEMRVRLGFIGERFSLERMTDQVEALYREVLSRH